MVENDPSNVRKCMEIPIIKSIYISWKEIKQKQLHFTKMCAFQETLVHLTEISITTVVSK